MAKRLSELALSRIFRRHDVKELIVEELGLAEENGTRTVRLWVKNNKPNGRLTCDACVKILCKELKLTKAELLEECEINHPIKPKPNVNPTDGRRKKRDYLAMYG